MKIGIMSLAHLHALGYVNELNARGDITVAIADPDAPGTPGTPGAPGDRRLRGESAIRQLGAQFHPTYEALLADGPDAVIICAENSRHRALAELAIAAGVPILCEKPLATSTADARAMVEAAERAHVLLMTAFPVRFSPAFESVRQLVSTGGLGDVIAAVGTNNGKLPAPEFDWFTDPARSGGGALTDHVVHVADLLEALFGQPAEEVYAQSNRITYADPEINHGGVETGGMVTIRYSGGVRVTIDCSWNRPPSYPTWGGLTLRLVGSGGIAEVDPFAQAVTGFGAGGATWLPWGDNLDAAMLTEFLTAVRTGEPAQPDGRVGLRTVQIVEAAYESTRIGQPVAITN